MSSVSPFLKQHNNDRFLSIMAILYVVTVTLFVCLLFYESAIFNIHEDIYIDRFYLYVYLGLILSFALRLWPDVVELIIILCLLLFAGFESVKGLMQIYGLAASGNRLFVLTGSFMSPGPYGGFVAVMSCILIAWMSNSRNNQKKRKIQKIEKSIIRIILLALCVVIPATQSRAAILAISCSLFLLSLNNDVVKALLKKHCIVLALGIITLCTVGYYVKKPSADGRWMIFKIDTYTMLNNGLIGCGFGHFSKSYNEAQYDYFSRDISLENGILNMGGSSLSDRQRAGSPMYAFNDYLQMGIESGPIAMLLYTVMIILSIVILLSYNSSLAYGQVALAIFGLFSYPICLWQFQLLQTLFISVSISYSFNVLQCKRVGVHLGVLVLTAVPVLHKTHNLIKIMEQYTKWTEERYFYGIEEYELYADYCREKNHTLDYVGSYLFEYSYSLSRTGNLDLSDSVLNATLKVNSNPDVLILMGDNSLERNDYIKAEQLYIKAFIMLPDRIKPLCRLAKTYWKSGDMESLKNIKESINNFHPRIESDITESLRQEVRSMQ